MTVVSCLSAISAPSAMAAEAVQQEDNQQRDSQPEDDQQQALEEKVQQSAAPAPSFLLYSRFGMGMLTRSIGESPYSDMDGPAFAVGLRYERGHFGLDLSAMSIILHRYGLSGTIARAMGMYILTPDKSHSAYAAAGIGFGTTSVYFGDTEDPSRATGPQGEAAIGYYVFRTSPFRLFVEGHTTLPFYQVESNSPSTDEPRWAPHFAISLGAAVDFLKLF